MQSGMQDPLQELSKKCFVQLTTFSGSLQSVNQQQNCQRIVYRNSSRSQRNYAEKPDVIPSLFFWGQNKPLILPAQSIIYPL